MEPAQDATLITAAADLLRRPEALPLAVLDAVTTPLCGVDDIRHWLTTVARHVKKAAPCCRAGADRCAYSRHALDTARRVLDLTRDARTDPAG